MSQHDIAERPSRRLAPLTHVVQQNGSGVQRKMIVSEPGDATEVEAGRMARWFMQVEHSVERQPDAPTLDVAEGKKKLHRCADAAGLARHEEQPQQE